MEVANEAHRFQKLNDENLKKIRQSEEESKAKQVEAEQKAEVDQAKRDRKDIAAQLTELNA